MKSTICNTLYAKRYTLCAILIALLCLILPQTSQAATYYVDIDGVGEDGIIGTGDDVVSSDANPGTEALPWKTIPYTWSPLRPLVTGNKVAEGDTVYFRNGEYGMFKEASLNEATVQRRSDWVTYKAATGHSPVFSQVYIHNQDRFGEVKVNDGSSYLIFDGFEIENGVALYYTSHVQIKNCIVHMTPLAIEGYNAPYFAGSTAVISFKYYISDVEVSDCNIYGGAWGIGMDNTYNATINGNEIHGIAEDAIHCGSNIFNVEITDNYVHTFRVHSSGLAVFGTISGTFVVGETVVQADTGAEGIVRSVYSNKIGVYETTAANFAPLDEGGGTVTGQTSGATLSNVSDVDYGHSDGFSIQGTTQTVAFRRNRIYGGGLDETGTTQGIKIDTQTSAAQVDDIIIENNVIRCIAQALSVASVTNMKINNNTLSDNPDNGIGGAIFTCGHGDLTILEFYNNIVNHFAVAGNTGGYTSTVVGHGNNIFGQQPTSGSPYPFVLNGSELISSNFDALFIDVDTDDFTLTIGSAAINFGNADYGPSSDILGNSRSGAPDAGCYEYGASTFLYGDVSGEGEISAYDAALTAQAAVDLITLTAEQTKAADVNGDSEISAYDAALIAQRAVGLIDKFPVE